MRTLRRAASAHRPAATATATACALGLALAACGSSSPTGTNASGSPASSKFEVGLKFSRCMRAHGVPTFPDPSPGGGLLIRQGSGIIKDSPNFRSAQQACSKLLPNGGHPTPLSPARQQAMLQFSQCMRAHGLTNFPDPQFSGGGISIKINGAGLGLAPNSPAFQSAQRACAPTLRKAMGANAGFTTQGP